MDKNNGIAEILLDFQIEYDIVENDLDIISNKMLIADRLKNDNLIISNFFQNGFIDDKEKFRSIVMLYFYKALKQTEYIFERGAAWDDEREKKWSQRKKLLAYLIDFRDCYIYYRLSETALKKSHRDFDEDILDVANFKKYFLFIIEIGKKYEKNIKELMNVFPIKYIIKADKKEVELTALNDIFEKMLDDIKNDESTMLDDFTQSLNELKDLESSYKINKTAHLKIADSEISPTNFLVKLKEQISEDTENLLHNIQNINTGIKNMSGDFALSKPPLFLIPIFIGSVKNFELRRRECDERDYGNLFFAYIKKENEEKNLDIDYHSNLYHLMVLNFMAMHSETTEESLKNLFRVAVFIDFLILVLGNKEGQLKDKIISIYAEIWKSVNATDAIERIAKNDEQKAREIYNNISLCFNRKIANNSVDGMKDTLERTIKDIVEGKDEYTTTNHFKQSLVETFVDNESLKKMCLAPFEYLSGKKVEHFKNDIENADKTYFGIQEEVLDDFVNFIFKTTYNYTQKVDKESAYEN